MNVRRVSAAIGIVAALVAIAPWLRAIVYGQATAVHLPAATSSVSSPHRTVLARYCVSCHNDRLKSGGLALDRIDLDHVADNPAVWERVVRKLRARAMP